MPKEDNKILKYNHGEKSLKVPFIIYADLECLLEKISTCINPYINPESFSHNNPEKSSTTKANEHTRSGYSLFTHSSFDATKMSLVVLQVKTVWRNFVWIWESMQQK